MENLASCQSIALQRSKHEYAQLLPLKTTFDLVSTLWNRCFNLNPNLRKFHQEPSVLLNLRYTKNYTKN